MRILIVDDSPQFLDGAVAFLCGLPEGHEVTPARNGADAAERLAEECFDLVLMDVGLPDVDGLTLTRRLAARAGAPPVIVVSLHEGDAYLEAAQDAGAFAFVTKRAFVTEVPRLLRSQQGGR